MNNARPGFPESDAVFFGGRFQKVVHFPILIACSQQVFFRPHLRPNQVVAMNRAGNRGLFLPRLDELQHGHLGRGILHRHAVRSKGQHGFSPLPRLSVEIVGVGNQNFFGQGQSSTELLASGLHCRRHVCVDVLHQLNGHDFSPVSE